MDWDFDELQSQVEKMKAEGVQGAQNTLNGLVPDDEPEEIDEPFEANV